MTTAVTEQSRPTLSPQAGPPLIGLSTYRENAAWGVWRQPADLLPANYANAVAAAGGVPVLLPPARIEDISAAAAAVVARLDGLIISGGADVEPTRYGADPEPHTTACRPERDAWELALLDAADAVGLPVLGICRGMQLMAIRAGGSLVQHLPDVVGHDEHSPAADRFGISAIRIEVHSRLRRLIGPTARGACHHHQAVLEHPGYRAVAFAPDGMTEAIEADGERFNLAVQWHPETADDTGLFAGLVHAANSARVS